MEGPSEAQEFHPPGPGNTSGPAGADVDGQIRFFLIADIRGYSTFTHHRGDEAAGRLAARFADTTQVVVAGQHGQVVELRGDEALAVFGSARAAVRAALALQQAYREQTLDDPLLPLAVGIGLDAGEAVPVKDGYRGAALNLAARLCALAGTGEVLASAELTHLAGHFEGVVYRARGQQSVKGFADPVHVVQVRAESVDAAQEKQYREVLAAGRVAKRRTPRRTVLVGAVVAVLVLGLLGGYVVRRAMGYHQSLFGDRADVFDAASGRMVGQVRLGEQPTAITSGAGSIWVVDRGDLQVRRIDPTTRQLLATSPLPPGADPGGIAVAGSFVWVTNQAGNTVTLINTANSAVVGHPIRVGNQPTGIAVGPSGVWVANSADATVSQINPDTLKVSRPIPVDSGPTGIAVTADAVWVTNAVANTVSKIDPSSGRLLKRTAVGQEPTAIAAAHGSIWVTNTLSDNLARLDPASAEQRNLTQIGDGPAAIAASDGKLWISNQNDHSLVQFDPATNLPGRAIAVDGVPHGIAATGKTLWAATGAPAAAHQGGTLTVANGLGPASFGVMASMDPAIAYNRTLWWALAMTSDRLVAFQPTGGALGAILVPDLAVSMPTISPNGYTYTFQLRQGLDYSDGRPVQASDFRHGVERLFELPFASDPGYYSAIRGSTKCQRAHDALAARNPQWSGKGFDHLKQLRVRQHSQCNLSRGIEADNQQGTVTFHLTKPDPDFLSELALPFATPVPQNTPAHERAGGVPGTGPYQVQSFAPGKELVLVRNPNFRVWSPEAQPYGYPDRIVVRSESLTRKQRNVPDAGAAVAESKAIRAVLHRTADLTVLTTEHRLSISHPAQLHEDQGIYLQYLSLETTGPPFNKVDARRALDYAIDRAAWAQHLGWGSPSCQVLPLGTPGYMPVRCRYGPLNLTRAKHLVVRSKTKGHRVTVLWTSDVMPAGQYLVHQLNEIGYHARLRVFPDTNTGFNQFISCLSVKGGCGAQVAGQFGWAADYPRPAGYFTTGCPRGSLLFGFGYCDPRLAHLVTTAKNEQQPDPAKAWRTWVKADKRVVDQAGIIPLVYDRDLFLTSARVHDYQHQPLYGPLLDQLWVQ